MKRQKKIKIIITIILSIVVIFSTIRIINILNARSRVSELQEELLELTEIEKTLAEYGGETYEFINVNFDRLLGINAETVGWIVFNQINFPIVQSQDNDFYLHHSFDHRRNMYGSIFMDFRNNLFYDQNTVVYGHNATNSRNMFGSLRDLLRENYFESGNDIIQISTPTKNMNYQIFSIYQIEVEDYYITPRFTEEEYQIFLNTMIKRSRHEFNITPQTTDRILTLSTCYGGPGTTRRLVVHAVLISTQIR